MGCSGGPETAPNIFEGEPNPTALQTCYDAQLTNNGSIQTNTICTSVENTGYNGLGVSRFIRFTVNAFSTVSLQVTRTSGINPADPDITLYRNGIRIDWADTVIYNQETLTTNLNAGNYVFEINEFTYSSLFEDEKSQLNFQTQPQQKTKVSNPVVQSTSPSNCVTGDDSTVSGVIEFARVPHSDTGNSLDYSSTTSEPVQQAVVEVICNGGAYSVGVTDNTGFYSLDFPNNQSALVRVKAQMLSANNWNFSVVDNTIASKPVYAMDGNSFVATANITRNIYAPSGWGGSRYTGVRVAAPFAILDSVRKAKDKILNVDGNIQFPELKINWSPDNSQLNDTGTFYDGSEIFLSGTENVDTDEYDEHVIIHEWAHYFEDNFSRSDSIGGIHGVDDVLDIRVAFSEGFSNAFSAIVTDNPLYIDTSGPRQSNGFSINLENNYCTNAGWFSECSVQSVLYDLYDNDADGTDLLNLDLSLIYNVLVGEQRNTQALTSVFSFIKPLKDQNVVSADAIDALLNAQRIDPVSDIYGSSQSTANPGVTDQLPIYETY